MQCKMGFSKGGGCPHMFVQLLSCKCVKWTMNTDSFKTGGILQYFFVEFSGNCHLPDMQGKTCCSKGI